MDTVFNFVQLIKMVQAEVGMGNVRVRPPRLELVGQELEQTRTIIRNALSHRPHTVGSYALPDRK
jgi:4-hydroxy-tetrahydrodipicolinate synthase